MIQEAHTTPPPIPLPIPQIVLRVSMGGGSCLPLGVTYACLPFLKKLINK